MDNLVSLLKAYGPAAVNDEVKNKILELIQTWATATEGRHELSYIGEVYRTLQREGYKFPPKVDVASSMLDSSAVSTPSYLSSWRMLTNAHSLRSGLIRKSVCAVEPHSALRTASTIAVTAVTFSTNNVHRRRSLYLISAYYSRYELTMAATLS